MTFIYICILTNSLDSKNMMKNSAFPRIGCLAILCINRSKLILLFSIKSLLNRSPLTYSFI